MVGLRRHRDEHVDAEQHDRGDDGRLARPLRGVGRLLVDADRRVPPPVDEDAEDQAGRERALRDAERVEPLQRRVDRAGDVHRVDLPERHDREDRERQELHPEQAVLRARRGFDADVTDDRHADHPDDPDGHHCEPRRGVLPDQQPAVEPRDVGQVRHHDDVGGQHGPAGHPADPGAERLGGPGERRPAVRVGLVEVIERRRDEEHRDE